MAATAAVGVDMDHLEEDAAMEGRGKSSTLCFKLYRWCDHLFIKLLLFAFNIVTFIR